MQVYVRQPQDAENNEHPWSIPLQMEKETSTPSAKTDRRGLSKKEIRMAVLFLHLTCYRLLNQFSSNYFTEDL
jgi:hypothetical protein